MPSPVDLEHDTAKRQLTIEWDDGVKSVYPMDYLRGWCPCAGCQGHGNVTRFHQHEGMSATHIEEVGAYALAFKFCDGHNTGIYRWSWFAKIAMQAPPRGYKRGYFEGGVYEAEEPSA